jgi:hypothetical protein
VQKDIRVEQEFEERERRKIIMNNEKFRRLIIIE